MTTNTTLAQPNMEFALDEDQESVAELAGELFSSLSGDDEHVASERAGDAYDDTLWGGLVETGLLEALLPDGDEPGLGLAGLALVAREQGRHLGRIPLVPTGVAALALAEFGGGADLLEGIVSGTARAGLVFAEDGERVSATLGGSGWILDGSVELGYMLPATTHVLVQVTAADGDRVAVVDLTAPGVSLDTYPGISGLSHAALSLTGVQVTDAAIVGADRAAGEVADWVYSRAITAMAAVTAGACAEAVRRTAAYTSEREQFGRPLSTNQGVTLRAADAHIDSEAIWLTTIDAAWQLDHGTEGAEAALVASWWASEGGFRVVHATQHLHGGMGADVDNHIHRFFTWVRELDIVWGSSGALADALADVILPGDTQ